jgi:hypothetical protein
MPYVRTLLQHVCVKTVDRAEYRQKTAQVGLMHFSGYNTVNMLIDN